MAGSPSETNPKTSSSLSRWFWAALITVAFLTTIPLLAPDTLGEQARRHLLKKLQDHYVGLDVSIGRGRFESTVGIIFENIVISNPTAVARPLREMVRIEQLVVVANIHPEKLLDKELPLTTNRIAISGFHANVTLAEDGTPSLSQLLPLPKLGPLTPRIDVLQAKINLFDPLASRRPIRAEIAEFSLTNTDRMDGGIDRTITAKGTGDFANAFQFQWQSINDANDIRCSVRGAKINRDLFDRIPHALQQPLLDARGLECIGDFSCSLYQTVGRSWNYRVRSTIHEGQFTHATLPKPITNLRGVIVADPQAVRIEASQASLGEAVVRASGEFRGTQWPLDADLKIATTGLLLDDQISAILPTAARKGWDHLQPHGRIDVKADLTCRSGTWDASAEVTCKGVDISYEKFPYPVRQLVGRVDIRGGIASSESLTGRLDSRRMQCAFRLPIRPGITNEKTFVIAADGPVAIDSTLIKALSHRGAPQSKLESFVRSLRPRGSLHLASAMFGTDASGRTTRQLDLRIIDGHLRYEKFAYPLYNVDGRIEINEDVVQLTNFRGLSANSGVVRCEGTYRIPKPSPDPKLFRISDSGSGIEVPPQLALTFQTTNIPMDNALRTSLPESAQHIWDSVAPGGVLDEADVTVIQHERSDPLQIDLTARQLYANQISNRSLSLRPMSLPYRIDISSGTVRYDGSKVYIDSLNGQHAASRLAADGFCVQGPSGRWDLTLNLKGGSRLNPDAELISALPNEMREAMRRLQLRGPVSVRGQTKITLPDADHLEPIIHWDVALQLEGNRIGDVGPVHSLRGEISVIGSRDDQGIRASGDVHIDSMHINDLQITSIQGPFTVVEDDLKLGVRSDFARSSLLATQQDPRNGSAPRSIQGRIFDGVIELRGDLQLSSGGFDVDLAVRDAQVPTILADFGYVDNEMRGLFSGDAALEGSLGTLEFLKGSGTAKVTKANIYQLPMIVQVLNQLRIKPTEDVAFTDGTVQFSVFGDTINFNELKMWGDWVALDGGGSLDGRHELDLSFNSRVSPQNAFTQIIRPLRGERYTLWTIDVKGPLHAPTIQRRAFEGVGETLERLIPTMNNAAPDTDPSDLHDEKAAQQPARGAGNWFR
ncbi:hypothetical protein Pla52o_41350 [Novipirellula galeiformis]|uniref:Uncharacterized protein n=1 Tax=Novipirellula galeiformis TaxID=2528004 RepID=A0A5C6CAE5_9BACT|nr:AsmA-like C-terminal region-containing protein [Novipirellula galeiformis]TWU21102.1 hypothetical protein Pla52o_41350 [Novipirellula galeiformis]